MKSRLREAIRNGCGWDATVLWKSSPSPPPAPDYAGAAQATASGNKEAAQLAQQANLINQNTPYGSLSYAQDPTSRFTSGNPSYSSNINLTPAGQQLLDQTNRLSTGLFGAQDSALTQVQRQGPMGLGGTKDIADKAYSNYTARLDPQWKQNTEMTENQLVNQGLRPGMEGYDNAMRDFNNAKNDAYTQANTAAISTMPQTYQLESAAYNQPLNTLNALRTGSQINNPQFGATPQQQTTPGPNMLGAAQAQGQYDMGLYNSQVGASNASNSGTMGLIGSAATAAAMFF